MLLDAIAVAGKQAELWLLDALASDCAQCLEECIGSGIVVAGTRAVAFSHEFARLAVEESIPVHRGLALHRAALAALESPPVGAADPTRLAHHAHATGDAASVLQFAPLAGQQASRLGAHREAAIHYGEALRFADLIPLETRALLFSGRAFELFLTVQFEPAVAAQEQALRCYEELGDRRGRGPALAFLAQLQWQVGSLPEAQPPRSARSTSSTACPAPSSSPRTDDVRGAARGRRPASAMAWAKRAEDAAEQIDLLPSRISALQMVGWVEFFTGAPGGLDKLASALELAGNAGLEDLVAQSYAIIVRTAGRRRE